MTTIFEQASRNKTRFDSPKGLLSLEDLWDLPLTSSTGKANLDDIARNLNRQLKDREDNSFVTPQDSSKDTETQLEFDLVKYVIDTRVAENTAQAQARLNREKKQQLMALISQKENEKLSSSSLEELKAMVEAMP